MPNTPTPVPGPNRPITSSSQPRMKLPIAPATQDLAVVAKAVTVHTSLGGRVNLAYIPADNDDTQAISVVVPSDWVSDTAVRRVTACSAVDGGDAATVWGLYN